MLRHWGSLTLLLSLSTFSRNSDERTQPPPSLAGSAETPPERAVPALFTWADVDGDGRLELAAVSEGGLRLLTDAGDGRFEDATARSGLGGVENAALALWVDYDADGKLDLFVGARAGASRLFHNEGGVFVDMTAASGLASAGAVQSAHWFDRDGDGRLDVFLVTAVESELSTKLFRGLEGGFFERAELPLEGLAEAGSPSTGVAVQAPSRPGIVGEGRAEEVARPHRGTSRGVAVDGRGPTSVRAVVSGSMPGPTSISPLVVATGCANSVRDQASPSACLEASTSPVLGKLYPLSANLFVAVSGDVGIGTMSPAARLHVAGTTRMTDTLTLAPSGDQALDVSTGSIYKGGALFIHTKGGPDNTALGLNALSSTTTGFDNIAVGVRALRDNTTGRFNTASGFEALKVNSTGDANTAQGCLALASNTSGYSNTATGFDALRNNTIGDGNTATGRGALLGNTNGFANTGLGTDALIYNTTGDRNTACGDTALSGNTIGNDIVYDEEGKPFTVKYHLLSAMLLNELEKLHAHERDLEARMEALESRAAAPEMPPERR